MGYGRLGLVAEHEERSSSCCRARWMFILAGLGVLCAAPVVRAQLDYPIPIHRGNGLANTFAKLSAGQSITIAYIGGSVTEGAGWRDLVTDWFEARYPGKITEVNAGWSGTGSLIGVMRFGRDVLAHDPDLVFIEFAVNDLPEDPLLFMERNSEGFMRQAWAQDPLTDICFIETIAWYSEAAYLSGNLPGPVQAHYNACDHYGCPSVNVGWALYEHVLAGTSWESLTINGDRVHPNAAGSQIYGDAVNAYLDSERLRAGPSTPHEIPAAMTDFPVVGGTITDLASIAPLPSGWTAKFNQLGAASFIESSLPGAQITIPFEGPAAALKLLVGPDNGWFSISIDGGAFTPASLVDVGWYWVWAIPVAKTRSFGNHTITFRVDSATVRLINLEDADTGDPGPSYDNLALTATFAAADTIYGTGFNGDKARDAQVSTKWTSTDASSAHWLAYDLGGVGEVKRFVVKHAGAGGEPSYYNTQTFTIESGYTMDGPWTVEFTGSNPGQADTSTFEYAELNAVRFVRLHVTDAGVDDFARIPEFEVWGALLPDRPDKGDLDNDKDVDQGDYGLFQACLSGNGITQPDPACEYALLDDDDDVDADDFQIFMDCFTGPGVPSMPGCGL